MGKTYEALRRAEAERRAKAEQAAEGQAPIETAPGAAPVDPTMLPSPAERNWFRFGRRSRATNGNGNGARGSYTNGYRNGNGNGYRDPFSFDVSPTTIEEFHQLRKNIFATKAPRSLQLMLLVSSRHGEGATTTTALLGSTMAQGGRCLLIDANFRTPGLSRIFGGVDAPGFCEALTNDPAGASFYHPTEIPNPTSCRRAAARAAALHVRGERVRPASGVLRREFDVILIDGADGDVRGQLVSAPRADGVILVVQAESTPMGAPVICCASSSASAHISLARF